MGLMNNKQIDYYDSVSKKKIPKQEWMREKLPADYWEKGTQSRKSKEQWFKVNVNILYKANVGQNQPGSIFSHSPPVGFLSETPTGCFTFIHPFKYLSHCSICDVTMQWVAPVDQALPTKKKWDGVQILNQYTKGYLEKECVDWLSKFMEYGDKELRD
ncbi:major histocompatibility complex class I-related gene protein-like [Salvelinus alpinus]